MGSHGEPLGVVRSRGSQLPNQSPGFERLEQLVDRRGGKNRGFGSEVSDLRGDLDANERVEMGNTCLGGE